MPVVTIAGQTGSGGFEIGSEVARILGADIVDRELIVAAAQRLGATVEAVAKRDERPITRTERVSKMLQSFLEKSAVAGSAGDPFLGPSGMEIILSRTYAEAAEPSTTPAQEISDTRYKEAVESLIKDLARSGNVVIMRRGGQMILHDLPTTFHVYLVAPFEARVQLVMKREGISKEAAEKTVRETDRNRFAYFRKFFKVDSEDPLLYHMVINTSRFPFSDIAQMIANTARALEKAAKSSG